MGNDEPRVLLVRHGQSEFNAHSSHLVGGRSSWAELTEQGKAQAQALGMLWRSALAADHLVLASTAVRATQTARYALETAQASLTRLATHSELEELDQGRWTGRDRSEIYTVEQQAVIDEDNWNFRSPGGESQADVFARVAALLEREVVAQGRTAWVVCHGVVITSLLAGWGHLDRSTAWKTRIANASITELGYRGVSTQEVRRNDTQHLMSAAT
ncbi:MAG: histidine phosphatase family protein [Myxococcota bacterium]